LKLDDAVDEAARMVRRIKEEMVRKHKGRVDLETTIICYRGDDPVALITLPPHRDAMLRIARIAAQGFGPDVMSVSHDTYLAQGRGEDAVKDPRTGEFWKAAVGDGPGAMQTYVEEHGFDGTVSEALITHVMNRAGDVQTIVRPYEVDGRTVTWTPLARDSKDMEFSGDVPDGLLAAMASMTVDQIVPAWAYDLVDGDLERARWHMDMATLQVMEEKMRGSLPVVVQLFAKPGTPRHQMFRTKVARSQIVDPSRWN
jgi:hypothetical protein